MLSGIKSGGRFRAHLLINTLWVEIKTGMILTSGGTDKRSGLRTHGKTLKGKKITKRKKKTGDT